MRLFCSGMRRRFRPNTHGLRPFWLSWKVWVTREAAGRTAVRGYGEGQRTPRDLPDGERARWDVCKYAITYLFIHFIIHTFTCHIYSFSFYRLFINIFFIYWLIMHLNVCKHVLSYAQKFLLISYKTLSNTAWHISSACRRSDGTFWMR